MKTKTQPMSKRALAFHELDRRQFDDTAKAAHWLAEKIGIGLPYARTLVSQWARKKRNENAEVKTFYKVSDRSGMTRLVQRYAAEKPEGYFASPKWAIRHYILEQKKAVDAALKLEEEVRGK